MPIQSYNTNSWARYMNICRCVGVAFQQINLHNRIKCSSLTFLKRHLQKSRKKIQKTTAPLTTGVVTARNLNCKTRYKIYVCMYS